MVALSAKQNAILMAAGQHGWTRRFPVLRWLAIDLQDRVEDCQKLTMRIGDDGSIMGIMGIKITRVDGKKLTIKCSLRTRLQLNKQMKAKIVLFLGA